MKFEDISKMKKMHFFNPKSGLFRNPKNNLKPLRLRALDPSLKFFVLFSCVFLFCKTRKISKIGKTKSALLNLEFLDRLDNGVISGV